MSSLHWPEYAGEIKRIEGMDLDDLLCYIDGLWGRDNLQYGATIEDVRAEALAQCERECRRPDNHADVERLNFHLMVGKHLGMIR